MQAFELSHHKRNWKSTPVLEVNLDCQGDSRPDQEQYWFESIIEGDSTSDEKQVSVKLPKGKTRSFFGQFRVEQSPTLALRSKDAPNLQPRKARCQHRWDMDTGNRFQKKAMDSEGCRKLDGRRSHAAPRKHDRGSILKGPRLAVTDSMQYRWKRDDDVSVATLSGFYPAILK